MTNRLTIPLQGYIRPCISEFHVFPKTFMLQMSGQHNPIGDGGVLGDAKQGFVEDENDNEKED